MITDTPVKVFIPKGKYYMGDPCYTVHDNEWYDVVKGMYDCESKFDQGKIIKISNGIQMCFTSGGDGYVLDQDGREYCIDSGSFGFVSVEHNPNFDLTDLVNVVEFHSDTECILDDGILTFGEYKIGVKNINW